MVIDKSLESVTRQLKTMERRKKPKMLVVDDEPDNLDLLYRTFRRDFRVFKADSGVNALDILSSEGEVAVIISDQRMPEMKGTEFLSQTVPQFPDTVRIILTGFTDVEDLVDAINSGQVYKYITKPWDPNELRAVVERAAETYDLLKQRTEELARAHQQMELTAEIVRVAQQPEFKPTDLDALATAIGKNFAAHGCILQLVEGQTLVTAEGSYAGAGSLPVSLEEDPLAQAAIASQENQIWVNSAATPAPPGAEHYADVPLQVHLLFPVLCQGKLLALLSFQWQQVTEIPENDLKLMHLCSQQIALALGLARS